MAKKMVELQAVYSLGEAVAGKSCSFQIRLLDLVRPGNEVVLTGDIRDEDEKDQTLRQLSLLDVLFIGEVEQLLPADRFPLSSLIYVPTLFYRHGIEIEVSQHIDRRERLSLKTITSANEKTWLTLGLSQRFADFDRNKNTFSTTDIMQLGKELHAADIAIRPLHAGEARHG